MSIIHSLPSQCHLDERFLPELSQRAEHRRVPQIPLLLHCLRTVSPRPPLIPSCSDGPSYYCCQWWRTRMGFQLPYWDPEGGMHAQSRLTLCDTLCSSHHAPLSLGFFRQEYWSGLTFPSPGNFQTQGSNLGFLCCGQSSAL